MEIPSSNRSPQSASIRSARRRSSLGNFLDKIRHSAQTNLDDFDSCLIPDPSSGTSSPYSYNNSSSYFQKDGTVSGVDGVELEDSQSMVNIQTFRDSTRRKSTFEDFMERRRHKLKLTEDGVTCLRSSSENVQIKDHPSPHKDSSISNSSRELRHKTRRGSDTSTSVPNPTFGNNWTGLSGGLPSMKKRRSPINGISSPMGSLMLSSSLSAAQTSAEFSTNRVGPEEFMQIFNRNRAYSDCLDPKQAAQIKSRLRKLSASKPPPMSPLAATGFSNPADWSPQAEQHPRSTPVSYTPVLPQTIPENKAVSHALPPHMTGGSRRRMSLFTSSIHVENNNNNDNEDDDEALASRLKNMPRRGRRFSAPTGPGANVSLRLQELSCRDLDEAMINFPKSTLVSSGLSNLVSPLQSKTGHVILWRAKGQTDKLFVIPDDPDNGTAIELNGNDVFLTSKLLKKKKVPTATLR